MLTTMTLGEETTDFRLGSILLDLGRSEGSRNTEICLVSLGGLSLGEQPPP